MTKVPSKEGRPRDATISRALVRAAERQMETGGFGSLSVEAVVTEVGTTRQTFYRRYPSISALALDVLCSRFGEFHEVDSGNLASDLLELQREDVAMMTSPLMRMNLPGLLEAVRSDEGARKIYFEKLIQPRRDNVHHVIQAAIRRGELSSQGVDPEYICDLLFGALLARTVLPVNLPVDDRFARRTVDTALRELRVASRS